MDCVLKQEPKFIVSVMADVNKASDLILDHVDKQRLTLGKQPYLAKNDPLTSMSADEEKSFKNAAIVKTRSETMPSVRHTMVWNWD